MTSKLQMAIIGCGASTPGKGAEHSIGYAHAWACNACKATKLVAVADIVKKNAEHSISASGLDSILYLIGYREWYNQNKEK